MLPNLEAPSAAHHFFDRLFRPAIYISHLAFCWLLTVALTILMGANKLKAVRVPMLANPCGTTP